MGVAESRDDLIQALDKSLLTDERDGAWSQADPPDCPLVALLVRAEEVARADFALESGF